MKDLVFPTKQGVFEALFVRVRLSFKAIEGVKHSFFAQISK